jgi:hypothetical protein
VTLVSGSGMKNFRIHNTASIKELWLVNLLFPQSKTNYSGWILWSGSSYLWNM